MTTAELKFRRERLAAGIAQSGETPDGVRVTVWPQKRVNGKEVFEVTWEYAVYFADDPDVALLAAEQVALGEEVQAIKMLRSAP